MSRFTILILGVLTYGSASARRTDGAPEIGTTQPEIGNRGFAGSTQIVRKHFGVAGSDQRCLRVAVAGVATRNAAPAPPTAAGTILLPPGPGAGNIVWAGLYWEILGDSAPPNKVLLNHKAVTPEALPASSSPCWPEANAYPYFADVTGIAVGGANLVEGLDDTGALGIGYNSEGASLVVVYQTSNTAACEIIITDGNDLLASPTGQADNVLPVICNDQAAHLYFIGADGQQAVDNQLWNGVNLGIGDDYNNSDPLAPGASTVVGWDSDLMPGGYNVPALPPYMASSNNINPTGGQSDCVNWLVTVLEVGVHDATCITPAKPNTWGKLRQLYK